MKPTVHSRRKLPLRALALFALLLSFSLPVARAQEETTLPDAAAPDRITSPLNPQGGIYYLDYGGSLYSPTTYPITGAQRVVGWSWLNPADGVYDWSIIDNRITATKAAGLKLGIMTTVYDGSDAGDIRSTPNFVIRSGDAVIPVNTSTGAPEYLSYWRNGAYNANFSSGELMWTRTTNAAVVSAPAGSSGYAAKLGGANNWSGYIYHLADKIPAMPPSLDGTLRVYLKAKVYISTVDTAANDHLYVEMWTGQHTTKLNCPVLDTTNRAHASGTWATYTFDVSNCAPGTAAEVTFRATTDAANATTFYVDDVEVWTRHLIPKYQSNAFSDPYVRFIQALGARYKSNPDVQYVSYGTGVYGENQPTQDNYDYVVKAAGLTSQLWIDFINKVTQAHADAFTVVEGQPPQRSQMVQYAPLFTSVQELLNTTDYAGVRKIGLSANFLSPDWTQAFKNDRTGVYDPLVKYLGQVPMSFEAYDSDLCNPVLSFMGMAQALDKKIDYQRADMLLFRNYDGTVSSDAPGLAWARPYFGKTAETTPKVWAMMREHRYPTLTTCRWGGAVYLKSTETFPLWPDLGNFDFFLKQVDTITGGRTVPETNDIGVDSRYARDPNNLANSAPDAGLGNCPNRSYRSDLFGLNYPCYSQPYNPNLPPLEGQNPNDNTTWYSYLKLPNWTGNGKEAYTVRRTDQSTGNPYMFFLIDDGYIPGSDTYAANITVKYFDIGTDKWSLKYDSTTGEKVAGAVIKTGTKTLKTATFTVQDGRFGGRLTGGADFYLDSRDGTTNDGNEWVHMVEVERTTALSAPRAPQTLTTVTVPDLTLSWAPVTQDVSGKATVVDHYDVWRSDTSPYFAPVTSRDVPYANVFTSSFTDAGALGAEGSYFYLVTAVNSSPSALSNRTGKFSFELTP